VLVARLPVMDGATRLGQVEIARSLRPDLLAAAGMAPLSGGLGLLIFLLLRVLPLRMSRAAIEQASFLYAHDLLTGLPNRGLFHDRLEQALANTRRNGGHVAVHYIDLDRFKEVNDLLGHPAGDATLRIVAKRLRFCLRETDTLARLGGDEFAVIQSGLLRAADAGILGRRLLASIDPPFDLGGQIHTLGLSVGIAVSEPSTLTLPEQEPSTLTLPEQMMKQADMALYRAKGEGRGRVCFYTPDMDLKLRERHALETDLRMAISGQNLTLYYQPQVDLGTARVIGAEALLRWNRPGHGMVMPDRFIPLAEDTGLIVPIGLWVLREACRRATTWPDDLCIAVNVSPVQFRDPNFCQAMIDTIRDTGIAPGRVELEITEGVLMQDTVETLEILQKLRDFGTQLAMDDFGTGYSSLGYLSKFRFDKIKIDRDFTARLGEDSDAIAIVRAIVGLTEAFGGKSNAEGVETSAQAEMLRAEGCHEGQGYLFGRPVPGDAFDALVRRAPDPAVPPGQMLHAHDAVSA
jgi:diguanylate cyclase (GGDEF)-like protein